MIIFGVILLVLGFLLGIHLLWIVGIVLACIGGALLLTGTVAHRPIGGRAHWY